MMLIDANQEGKMRDFLERSKTRKLVAQFLRTLCQLLLSHSLVNRSQRRRPTSMQAHSHQEPISKSSNYEQATLLCCQGEL